MSASRRETRALSRIPLSNIRSAPDRPRGQIPPESIERLAESIRLHGLLTPLLVKEISNDRYRLVSGERRLRALALLNRTYADAIVLTGDACDCALISLVENIQRESLHFLDIAAACRAILDHYPITQERLAASLSCSPSALANRLRLLKLSEEVRSAVRSLGLTERHARALLRLGTEADQLSLAALAAEKRLSVSQLEKRVEDRLSAPARTRSNRLVSVRDSRVVVNALLDTVRRLSRIGVPVRSRVEQGEGFVNVIVTIPASAQSPASTAATASTASAASIPSPSTASRVPLWQSSDSMPISESSSTRLPPHSSCSAAL